MIVVVHYESEQDKKLEFILHKQPFFDWTSWSIKGTQIISLPKSKTPNSISNIDQKNENLGYKIILCVKYDQEDIVVIKFIAPKIDDAPDK